MAANFREVASCSGVDENLPTGGQGIVVPSGGSTLVILEDARGLEVRSTLPSKVNVYEFTKRQERAAAAQNASNSAEAMRRFDEDSWRIFKIKADAPVGFDKVKVEAKNTKSGKAEATLKVIVLDKKTVKVAIRPVQVRDGQQLVSLGGAADAQNLLNEMNAIWNPQANVYFELGRADAATIDGLSLQAEAIEMQKLTKGFLDERDSGSVLTFFLVRKVTNGGKPDKGATNAKESLALIADSRSDSTMAHEAGHFLGALNAKGKYDSEYGHPEKSQEMLMHVDHIGKKIPYSAVLKFNYGYHR
jgi:hypothetical protein